MEGNRSVTGRTLLYCIDCGAALAGICNFCTHCGLAIVSQGIEEPSCLRHVSNNVDQQPAEEEIIRLYFNCGYKYEEIIALLGKYHAIEISMSTLQRRLRSYGLGRGKNGVNEHSLKDLIRAELDGAGCLGGYRSVWHSLRLVNGVSVPRNTVAVLLKEIDPIGVENRRKRRLRRREYSSLGPNYAWHADGYDKLKDFGFPIHGCIDGYSRKLLWLELTRSNNNPAIIAGFYLDYVKEVGGCPVILSTDPGSENCVMSAIQVSLRSKCDDEYSGEKSHRFVESKRNQRIEAWWSYFRRNHSSWWINLFNDLVQKGLFLPGNEMHKECLWFCLSKFLRNNLNFVRVHWNTHYIRKSRFDTIPGKPDALYYLPENEGHTDQLITMSTAEIQSFQEHCLRISDRDEDNEYHNYFKYVIEKDRLSLPDSWREGVQLYIQLITTARD